MPGWTGGVAAGPGLRPARGEIVGPALRLALPLANILGYLYENAGKTHMEEKRANSVDEAIRVNLIRIKRNDKVTSFSQTGPYCPVCSSQYGLSVFRYPTKCHCGG